MQWYSCFYACEKLYLFDFSFEVLGVGVGSEADRRELKMGEKGLDALFK